MTPPATDSFGTRATIETAQGRATLYRLAHLEETGVAEVSQLPRSLLVLLESMLRTEDGFQVTAEHIETLARWDPRHPGDREIPFRPARVLLQDFTGVPSLVDLAALRSAMDRLGGNPGLIHPQVPVDLVIDHSIQVDRFGIPEALQLNSEIEFQRNRERYEFLHWGQSAFEGLRVVPPATGIVHQVNLEYLAPVVTLRKADGEAIAHPDSLVGTDSHTPMIGGLGVVGWGVGGIEAEAAILGQPLSLMPPKVVGFELTGALPEGATATDLVLTITQILRKRGVVGKFVEFYGDGLEEMSVPDRATVSNMSPEQGATLGYFPIDDVTLAYLRFTGRDPALVRLVEQYAKAQGLFRERGGPVPAFSERLTLDLDFVEPSLAGPKRPHDRVSLSDLKASFRHHLTAPLAEQGFALDDAAVSRTASVTTNGAQETLHHGSVVIAAITSCTNTSNPDVMLGAGLLAQKAVERGLTVPPYVKTSLAPGSRVVTNYLEEAGLLAALERLGFYLVGYGCTTCIGNSGPLDPAVAGAVEEGDLVAVSVLSGNRNFEGRINPHARASYLASPPLVVAFGLAGRTDIDLTKEPLGTDREGGPVFLRDIWPSQEEIRQAVASAVTPEQFRERYAQVFTGNETWNAIAGSRDLVYPWNPGSTYIREPPFFEDLPPEPAPLEDIRRARVLVLLGDSVTTDHISPAGAIPQDGPAGRYLLSLGVEPGDFNSFGSRRGNHHVMVRGTFGNIRLKNLLVPGTEGGVTRHFPSGESMDIYDAAVRYREEGTPLLVIAGKEYGSGSSRDWAAKGTQLLGVRAVIAESYERIHRSNLVGMGVLPLEFLEGEGKASLGLVGDEVFDVEGLKSGLSPKGTLRVTARSDGEPPKTFSVVVRIESSVELEYYRNGGILHRVLRALLAEAEGPASPGPSTA